jgi:outer membrane protein TolC
VNIHFNKPVGPFVADPGEAVPAADPLPGLERSLSSNLQDKSSHRGGERRWCRFSVSAACLVAALLVGCQSYQPDPLNLSEHSAAWRSRTASSEKVRTFAKRLAAKEPARSAFNPSDGLSLTEGETVALIYNPDLRIARLRAGVARATADHAGRWDDPEFSIDVLKITDSVPDPWVVGSAISLTLPISGRLQVEKARAEAASEAELVRVAESEWEVLRDLRAAWLSWSATGLRLEQTEQIVGALDSIIDTTSLLAEQGELPKTEAALFTIEQERRRAERDRLKGNLAEQEQQIRSLMGLSPSAPARMIPTRSAVREVSSRAEPDDSNPSLARLRGEYAVAEQTLLREVRKQYPDVVLGPQSESDQGQSRIGVIGAIPVPILNSNKGGIATARAERELAKAAYETEYERIVGRLAAQRARLQGVHARRTRINGTLVPMVDRQMEDARRLVELGEGGSLVLLESLVRAHEAKMELIDIQLEHARAHNESRFLLGPKGRRSTNK